VLHLNVLKVDRMFHMKNRSDVTRGMHMVRRRECERSLRRRSPGGTGPRVGMRNAGASGLCLGSTGPACMRKKEAWKWTAAADSTI
jgi:hypothetical protein